MVNGGRLCFAFVVEDADIVVAPRWQGESTLDGEDRVEIFFACDPALRRYYCIEVDSLGRVHDYAASYYRKFDSSWNCRGLQTAARHTRDGYVVEGAVPLATLTKLLGQPVERGSRLHIGLFRAEFYGVTRGERDDNWLSWVKPTATRPDFHLPSAFREWTVP